MNLRDLRYLVAVARYKHFGKAAEACFVSQPTLSTQIKKLEESLDVTLIERSHKQALLTPAGAAVVGRAERVLRDVDELIRTAEAHRDPLGGDLRLGIIPTVAPYLLPKILPSIRRALPKLNLKLSEGQTASIRKLLDEGELDALILALPSDGDQLESKFLYREPFYFAASRAHPKADQKTVSVDDLDHERVLLLEDGHCLRDQALEICKAHNAVENTNFRATSIETLRQMVAANIGVTLMPALAVGPKSAAVRYIPFRGNARGASHGDLPHRDIGIVWRKSAARCALLARLAAVIGEACID
jgi:LysR family transcriptional regulator, hydrogen peroxide-inducible genes activator